MPDLDFRDIDFSLPAHGRLAAARDIGRRCAQRFADRLAAGFPIPIPEAVAGWTPRCRAAWQAGIDESLRSSSPKESPSLNAPVASPTAGMLVGYARVSTQEQNLQPQLDVLTQAGCQKQFLEKASGAQRDRPELARALEYMRPGDTLVVWKLDRLARSLKQLIETVETLDARGIGFRSLTEAIDTTSAGGKLVFHLFGALAEFERAMIRERTRAGLASARSRGRVGGRPRSLGTDDLEMAKTLLANPEITVEQVAARLRVAPSTLYRYLPGGRAALEPGNR